MSLDSITSTYNESAKNSEKVVLTPDPTIIPHFRRGLGFEERVRDKWAGQKNTGVPCLEHSRNQGRSEQGMERVSAALWEEGVTWVTDTAQEKAGPAHRLRSLILIL